MILRLQILSFNQDISGIYNNKIDLSRFSQGTYIIHLKNNTKVFTKKFIIE